MDLEQLITELVTYLKRKFYTRRNIVEHAEEIVNQAFLDVTKSPEFNDCMYNFGYMSVACIRAAYKVFHRNDRDRNASVSLETVAPLIDENSFVAEIEKAEDTDLIVQSLQTLKEIERVIINERYYGGFTFREISEKHGINLNTILSHHRRALVKLKPVLSAYFSY